jgi:hypothetical protein
MSDAFPADGGADSLAAVRAASSGQLGAVVEHCGVRGASQYRRAFKRRA